MKFKWIKIQTQTWKKIHSIRDIFSIKLCLWFVFCAAGSCHCHAVVSGLHVVLCRPLLFVLFIKMLPLWWPSFYLLRGICHTQDLVRPWSCWVHTDPLPRPLARSCFTLSVAFHESMMCAHYILSSWPQLPNQSSVIGCALL